MKEFWKAAGRRALRTFCQTAGSTIGTSALLSSVDWLACLSSAALAAILSILTSIATGLPEAPVNDDDLAELRKTENIDKDPDE